MKQDSSPLPSCPLPLEEYPQVLMAHGGGGMLMQRLIRDLFAEVFGDGLQHDVDAALLEKPEGRVAFTTDSFVVHPMAFPGGDIGSLAVHGTVNDLAMAGARPLALSAGFIIEEGLPVEQLWRFVLSMKRAADEAGVRVVTGDTKVVERGRGDGLYINTSGVGVVESSTRLAPDAIREGDVLLISGDLGRHAAAILAAREELKISGDLRSDSAPLVAPVLDLLSRGIDLHCLRDLTRGGLASALHELARDSGWGFRIQETAVPVSGPVNALCELLGFDPLHLANEGRFLAVLPENEVEPTLEVLKRHSVTEGACVVGRVEADEALAATVLLRSAYGVDRVLTLPAGQQQMRIC